MRGVPITTGKNALGMQAGLHAFCEGDPWDQHGHRTRLVASDVVSPEIMLSRTRGFNKGKDERGWHGWLEDCSGPTDHFPTVDGGVLGMNIPGILPTDRDDHALGSGI